MKVRTSPHEDAFIASLFAIAYSVLCAVEPRVFNTAPSVLLLPNTYFESEASAWFEQPKPHGDDPLLPGSKQV